MPSVRWIQTVGRVAALTAALLIGADDADVRLADALSLGSGAGGSGAFFLLVSAAAAETVVTRHAPAIAQAGPQAYPGGSLTELFNRGGLLGGFAAGFLGSGLLGLLFGRGLFAGLGGVPSYLGLLFQLALLAMLCRLIWTRWRGGDAAGVAALSPRQLADPYLRSRDDLHAGVDSSTGADDAIETDTKPVARPSEVAHTGKRE